MFETIKQRFRDMSTIKALCLAAERHANADGQKEPGAEHFVLAALELPDGTARKAFEHIQADPNGFRAAIAQQHADALKSVGMEVPPGAVDVAAVAVPPSTGVYHAQASAQTMMQQLASQQKANAGAPLLSAHVLVAVAAAQHGVAIRALKAMGVDPKALAEAAAVEISAATVYEI